MTDLTNEKLDEIERDATLGGSVSVFESDALRLIAAARQAKELRALIDHCCKQCECNEDQLELVITAKVASLKILNKMYADVEMATFGSLEPRRHMHSDLMDRLRAALAASGEGKSGGK